MAVASYRNSIICLSSLCAITAIMIVGCDDNSQDRTRRTEQALNSARTKSDALNDVTRYLSQMTPLNRTKVEMEVQLHLNKWWQTADKSERSKISADLIDGVPPDLRSQTEFALANETQFNVWDVEYLYQCRLYRQLSTWIVERPLKDSLLLGWLDEQSKTLPPEKFAQLEQAFKLFDWSVRNIILQGSAKDVETLVDDPRKPIVDSGTGYKYLPWQTILYARGDFVERGRTFTALAQQRELQTCWLALRLPSSPAAKLWTIGVWVGDDCYLFEPKLGLPILDPETATPATLAQVQKDERILRRLDVPGRFDYAVNPGDAAKVEFLLEIEPSAATDRMAVLQGSLTGEDRLWLQPDWAPLKEKIQRLYPQSPVALWQVPWLARLFAIDVRDRLQMNSPFTAQYIIEHAVWYMETPAALARLKHLSGQFENTFDERGALATYMDCRLPDEVIDRLPEDPDAQKELAIPRLSAESMDEYKSRLQQLQIVFRQAKLDASFLLGQLHYELGNYADVEGWMAKRTIGNPTAAKWHAAARYTLARAYQQTGKISEAIAALNEDESPMEAGNRLRVRYLSR
ncbi:MAG: CDC27 family protein [Pirellulaceae bacterium]|nr:CDC27 family protein [Pirellulaceae bacterium]